MNTITMKLQADHLIEEALREDISSEDVTTNSVMKEAVQGEVNLICKQDGIIAGLDVFQRVFELLDEKTKVQFYKKDGDEVKGVGNATGNIRSQTVIYATKKKKANALKKYFKNPLIQTADNMSSGASIEIVLGTDDDIQ